MEKLRGKKLCYNIGHTIEKLKWFDGGLFTGNNINFQVRMCIFKLDTKKWLVKYTQFSWWSYGVLIDVIGLQICFRFY